MDIILSRVIRTCLTVKRAFIEHQRTLKSPVSSSSNNKNSKSNMACSLHSIQFFPPELIYVPFIMVLSRQGNWGCAGKEINCWVFCANLNSRFVIWIHFSSRNQSAVFSITIPWYKVCSPFPCVIHSLVFTIRHLSASLAKRSRPGILHISTLISWVNI